jgi:hypothetical protein
MVTLTITVLYNIFFTVKGEKIGFYQEKRWYFSILVVANDIITISEKIKILKVKAKAST